MATYNNNNNNGYANEKDLEVGAKEHDPYAYNNGVLADGAVRGETFETGNSLYARLQRFAGKYGVEQRGIERVPEDERTDVKHPYLNTATMVCYQIILRSLSNVLIND
jgi:hypothetical protein